MNTDFEKLLVKEDTSLREAMAHAEANRCGIVLVVDDDQKLVGTITDGDVRRAILSDANLDEPVSVLLANKAGSLNRGPITASERANRSELLRLFQEHKILHIPLVNQNGRVVGLSTLGDLVSGAEPQLQAVIMAGGVGSRLRPLTDKLPKPMLPMGDRPLLEVIVDGLKDAGIKNISLAVHHDSAKITDHFGDGKDFGVDITYANEERPMGTAGALGIIDTPTETTLVINGDILTRVDFRAMLAFHQEHGAELTIGVHEQNFQVPYGVIERDGVYVQGFSEKPVLKYFVNAGMYLLEPSAYEFIPNGGRYDMTDLIQRMIDEGRPVVAFPVHEYWIDIGQPDNYVKAQQDYLDGNSPQ